LTEREPTAVSLNAAVEMLQFRCESSDQAVYVPSDVSGMGNVVVDKDWVERELVSRFGSNSALEFRRRFGNDLASALLKPTGKTANGQAMCVWHDYIAGTDPTDSNDCFVASIEMRDGHPYLSWTPNLNGTDILFGKRTYAVWGRESLTEESPWQYPTNALHRFFKVTVEMP